MVAGQAVTAATGLSDNLMMHAALRVAQAGDVLVVACNGSLGAQCGDLVATAAKTRGLAAIVTDGAVRDVDAIEDIGFPVWAHVVAPHGARKDVPGWVNRPVTCSGVHVCPGDVVIGDGDGVVVVPMGRAPEVLEAGQRRAQQEDRSRRAIADGALPGDLSGIYEHLDGVGIVIIESAWEP
jgi:4-hydroxy-4-methyl-2-oxoglutarate aldolase